MAVRDARPSVNVTRKGAKRSVFSVDDRGGMENRNFHRPYYDRLASWQSYVCLTN